MPRTLIVFLCLMSLTFSGCSTPDESEARQQQAQAGPPELTPEIARWAIFDLVRVQEASQTPPFLKGTLDVQSFAQAPIEPLGDERFAIGPITFDLRVKTFALDRSSPHYRFRIDGAFELVGNSWKAKVTEFVDHCVRGPKD